MHTLGIVAITVPVTLAVTYLAVRLWGQYLYITGKD